MNYTTRIVLLIIFPALSGWAFQGSAQKPKADLSYARFTGTVGKDLPVVLHLIRTGDSLYGDFNYCQSAGTPSLPFPGSHRVHGKPGPGASFRLSDYDAGDALLMKGKTGDDGSLAGLWMAPGTKGVQVKLTPSRPEGSTLFIPYYKAGSRKLAAGSKSPRAVIQLALVLPEKLPASPATDSLRHTVLNAFTGNPPRPAIAPESLLDGISQNFFTDYVTSNQSFYKEMPGASFNWEMLKFIHILYNSNSRVSFGLLSYSFTGGAHGMETELFTTLDMKTGRTLRLADLFRPGYEQELARLLTRRLKNMKEVPDDKRLSESGYFKDEIRPTENFYLNENGVGFFYNRYEIAPYAWGETDIFLTFQDLKPILK